jgi:fructose-1-phosphate kinase PfkB-like protein
MNTINISNEDKNKLFEIKAKGHDISPEEVKQMCKDDQNNKNKEIMNDFGEFLQ